jgi:hypothetical protein
VPRLRAEPRSWIVSPSQDLIWFQGSVAAGIALLGLFLLIPRMGYPSGHTVALVVFLWGALFDGTHVWGTYARSYLAPDQTGRGLLPGAWSWGLLGIGPVVAWVAALSESPELFGFFVSSAYLWAYWHLVRQHYGFLMLYRSRAGECDPRTACIDSLVLWVGCLYPFLLFSLGDPYRQSGLPRLISDSMIAPARYTLDTAFGLALAALAAIIASQRIGRIRLGPKHLLMAIVISFHCLVFSLLDDLLAILATLTIFHNLQYHRIVWLHEAGLGRKPSGGLLPYLMFGIGLGALWYGIRVLGAAAAHSELQRNLLVGLGWGVAFHHYLVDGRIWHVRRSKSVSRALGFRAAA